MSHSEFVIYRISSVIRRVFFSFQNNPKVLDPSCKTDLELWHCLGRVELVLWQNFIGLIKLFEVILEGRKPRLIAGKIRYLIANEGVHTFLKI